MIGSVLVETSDVVESGPKRSTARGSAVGESFTTTATDSMLTQKVGGLTDGGGEEREAEVGEAEGEERWERWLLLPMREWCAVALGLLSTRGCDSIIPIS